MFYNVPRVIQPAEDCNSSNISSVLQSDPPEMYSNMHVTGEHSQIHFAKKLIQAVFFTQSKCVSEM